MRVLFVNTRRKLGIHAQTLGTVLNRGVQADARGATQALDRGRQAVVRGSCLSQALDLGAEVAARGAVSCALQVLDRGGCPGRCPDRCLRRQEKDTRQVSRRAEKILPGLSAQRQGTFRGDAPLKSW